MESALVMSIVAIQDNALAEELWAHAGHKLTIRRDPGGVYVDCDKCAEILIGFEYGDD